MTVISEKEELPVSLAALLVQLDQQGIRDYRRYDRIRSWLIFRAREQGIPISGTFELTPLCNLDCRMCYVHLNREQMKGKQLISVSGWKELMQQAVDAGMMYARLTGGECLTYPGFRELYLFLQERGIETGILSNGVLLGEEMTDFLQENPPAQVRITLYGAGEEGYERVTGHRVFGTVIENLQRLQAGGIPVSVAVTPNAFMEDGEEIVRLAHRMGLPLLINSGLMTPRKETGRKKADADLGSYVRMLKLKYELNTGEQLSLCEEASLPVTGGNTETQVCGVRCGAGRSSFSISWDGRMRPCNTFPDIEENVLEAGFAQAWKKINDAVQRFPGPAECEQCNYIDSCKHCIAEHASDAPIGHASPAICAWARRMAAEGLIKINKR